MNQMHFNTNYRTAEQIVNRKLSFYSHLAFFVIINCGLITINLLSSPNHWWAQWPILGWSIGVAAHALHIFAIAPSNMRQRMIADELAKRVNWKD